MSEVIIRSEGLGKLYRLGEIGTGTLSHDLNRWWSKIRGKEDPFSKIGEINDRTIKGQTDYVWAIKDLDFEVKQGEVMGIIGRNGAGKSTLLKILSKITRPTRGRVSVCGRVASLLEVGTGFHPEMTGRENIFMNGAILGMRNSETKIKFDEIVDFAGVERYIDTPVKRYSSGMYVRLAFAVAAYLEPEILIVDEVLAVGDSEFQKKCLGRMKDVSVNDGRSVLFVSHNMTAISALCKTGLYLKNGEVESYSHNINALIAEYLHDNDRKKNETWEGIEGDEHIRIFRTAVYSASDLHEINVAADIIIEIEGEVLKPILGLILGFTLWSQFDYEIAYVLYDDDQPPPAQEIEIHSFKKRFKIPANTLAEGSYHVQFDVGIHMLKRIINNECDLSFNVVNIGGNGRRFVTSAGTRGRYSILRPNWFIHE